MSVEQTLLAAVAQVDRLQTCLDRAVEQESAANEGSERLERLGVLAEQCTELRLWIGAESE